ncbi:hypothetical protein GLX27_001945 [Malassezia furfur]|uniref:Signal peptidase complex subunit 2 n=1 Tax=Malassezia furfur TaxID=55194 RepID=A0ABY8EP32_MALFU|nr:hypothetical protein CBS14141_003514 [Malassezia furfur]WFD47294.1 hypothetical protein GLX27_001945 [Malassezia furfur]
MSGAQSSGAPQVCNTASIKDTKYFCDDAIERLLTQRPSAERTPSAKGKEKSTVEFAPFQASHTVDDVLMAVSLTGSVIMLGTVGYVYLKKVEWPIARQYYLVAVSTFAVLFALQSAIKYFAGPLVFRGTRKMLSNRVEVEYLRIQSPAPGAPRVTNETAADGRPILVPPEYKLEVWYTRKSNGGKSVLATKHDYIVLGHFGEWFTETGEFVESVFEQRLLTSLQRVLGE